MIDLSILPDHLRSGLRIIFCGAAVGTHSAKRGHYYSGPGNDFWRFLYEANITSVRLQPDEDHRICEFGCGLTDLAKKVAASSDAGLRPHYAVAEFVAKIETLGPSWIAFHGKEAAEIVARHVRQCGQVHLGLQLWRLGGSAVFVLPSASGANRDISRLEGKAHRLDWFNELARVSTESSS